MAKARVHYLPDGRVAVTYPAPGCRLALFETLHGPNILQHDAGLKEGFKFVKFTETEDEWHDRACSAADIHSKGYPHEDIDPKDLPPREVIVPDGNGGEKTISLRNMWTGEKGKPLCMDPKMEEVHASVLKAKLDK